MLEKKIAELPTSIKTTGIGKVGGWAGLTIRYRPTIGKWSCSYGQRRSLVKVSLGNSPLEAVENFTEFLKKYNGKTTTR